MSKRQPYTADEMAESIRKAVEAAPPLPEDAKRRIASILTRVVARDA